MGDVAQPFCEVGCFQFDRDTTIKDFHEVGDASFDVGLCIKASGEVGGFNFDMGGCRKALDDGTDASCAAIYGDHAFFKLSDAANAFCEEDYGAFCDAGDGVEAFREEIDGPKLDWVSPRISFSQDLTLEEPHHVEASGSSRGFPEKRKWQEGENGELDEGAVSDFEFSNDDVVHSGFSHHTKDLMLPADELFLDGKLLPMHTQQTSPSSSAIYGDLITCRSKLTLQESHVNTPNLLEAPQKSIVFPLDTQQLASFAAASCGDMCMQKDKSKLTLQECDKPNMVDNHQKRHLSLDLPQSISSSTMPELAPLVSLSVDNSPCSSPPRTSSPPRSSPVASTTPVSHKAISKYTSRIKELFKPKKVSSSVNAQLTRDNSTTSASTCRIPIPPRAFWPFSRSNSAGESKTTTPPAPTLPPRSNSAGESNTSRVSPACKSSSEAHLCEQFNTSGTSHAQDPMISGCEDVENSAKTPVDAGSLSQSAESSNNEANNDEEESVKNTAGTSQNDRRSNTSNKGRVSGSPGRSSRKRYMYTTANFLRGSPGRRGGLHSLAKIHTSRIVLRNLERCSAERKLCQERSSRRATTAYPVALRVSPVINVAVYRGKMPSSGMFGLGSLFSSKKEKGKEKEAPVNNWRMGA